MNSLSSKTYNRKGSIVSNVNSDTELYQSYNNPEYIESSTNPRMLRDFQGISLNKISRCQYCNFYFDSKNRVPLLFKCEHFFCKQCILEKFISNNVILCPYDSHATYSLNEMKILSYLINNDDQRENLNPINNSNQLIYNVNEPQNEENNEELTIQNLDEDHKDNYILNKGLETVNSKENNTINNRQRAFSSSRQEFCKVHPTERLAYFIENTLELVCVHCAFGKFRKNSEYQVYEINEKCANISYNIINHLHKNYSDSKILSKVLNELKKNKDNEEMKITNFFNDLMKIINDRKIAFLEQINKIYTKNHSTIENLITEYSEKIEILEKVNSLFEEINMGNFSSICDSFNSYYHMISEFQNEETLNNLDFNFIEFQGNPNEIIFGEKINLGEIKEHANIIYLGGEEKEFKQDSNEKKQVEMENEKLKIEKNDEKPKIENLKDEYFKNKKTLLENKLNANPSNSKLIDFRKIRVYNEPSRFDSSTSGLSFNQSKNNISYYDKSINLNYQKIINSPKQEISNAKYQKINNYKNTNETFIELIRKRRIFEGKNSNSKSNY